VADYPEYPSGAAFPFRFNAAGSVARDEGDAKIRSNLIALVKSNVNERLVRKMVGVIGHSLVLRSTIPGGDVIIKNLIEEAIAKFEPRVVVESINIRMEETPTGMAKILDLHWRRKTSPSLNKDTIKLE